MALEIDKQHTALLTMDFENDIIHPEGAFKDFGFAQMVADNNVLDKAAQLLAAARGAGVEVIFGAPLELSREYEIENIKESSTRIVDRVMQAISSLLEGDRAETPHPAGALEEAGK